MRKMKKYRFFVLACVVFLFILNETKAQGNFEDADKLSDLMSTNTEQHFDLRHTIPGIPEVDYPIYSHVPKTSFECTGRHEGYYADMESRCQAFRICTHTARSVSGFGFLCPNGTLFSQKYFVCDWYRNVNCDDSERFYSKNDINRVGSSFDMMETVRQMMEYPMKTISKALQQNSGSNKKPTQRHRGSNRGSQSSSDISKDSDLSRGRGRNSSNRKSITRDQVESAQNRGSTKFNKEKESIATEQKELVIENGQENGSVVTASDDTTSHVVSSSSSDLSDEIYVNSLGELSTDPGVTFDRTNAHIIAEPRRSYRYEKNMNFAEKVNAGLNDLIDLPSNTSLAPDYVKSLREDNNDGPKIDLPSNINGLLDEIAYELNPSTSGYQVQKPTKAKHAFRFLSRGFSSQEDPYKYTKPKQTASTIRFTPNQLPVEEEKKLKKPVLDIAPEAVPFGHSTISPETPEPPLVGDAIDYLLPPPELPAFEEVSYLSPPILESTDTTATIIPTEEITGTTISPDTVEPEQEIYTVTPETPTYAALAETTTPSPTTDVPILEIPTIVPDIVQNLVASPQQVQNHQQKFDAEDSPIDEDRIDVNKQAENLFISGLQLTTNENNTEASTVNSAQPQTPLLIQVAEDHSYLTAWVTSTVAPQTTETVLTTTPETTIESGSLQERIRNYRRLANLQRGSAKPLIYGKRAGLRMTKTTTPSSTTPKPTTTTRSYLKRIAASRLRLSRLTAAAGNKQNQSSLSATPAPSPVDNAIDSSNNKKLTVRNIDKEIGNPGNNIVETGAAKKSDVVTWESVKNSLQRFQINRNPESDSRSNIHTTTSPQSTSKINVSSTTQNALSRMRNRISNFKPPFPKSLTSSANIHETTNEPVIPIATSVSISSSSSFSQPSSISFLNSIPLVPPFPSPVPTRSSVNEKAQNDITTFTTSSTNSFTNGAIADKTTLNSNSASASNSFIPFDKLTRSIVDDSFLQNYRGGQIIGRSSLQSASNINSFQQSSIATSRSSSGQVNHSPAHSTFTQSTPVVLKKVPTSVPSQASPSQHLVHQPIFNAPSVPATSGPRIVVARAEGQRIEPNDVSSLISSLITQKQKPTPKSVHTTSYVPLNDFLTKKFGNFPTNKVTPTTTSNYNTQQRQKYSLSQNQQQQQLQQTNSQRQQQAQYQQPRQQYQQQQQQQQQQHIQQFNQQPQIQGNRQQLLIPAGQQERQKNNYYQSTPQIPLPQPVVTQTNILQRNQPNNLFNHQSVAPSAQPLLTQNIFSSFKQQQQQLPQFPPLAPQSTTIQHSTQFLPQFDGNNNYLNVQLPTLSNGLIPAPTNQIAQKRSDYGIENLELSDFTPADSVFTGLTSYDVPLNSIGRLPNDMQALFRRLRKY